MSSTITISLKQLQPHPAQMRTQYNLDNLAGLTLQVYQRGLDAWQPLLVSQKETGCHIVSGHRRHMALLLSLALQDWAAKREEETEITVEVVQTMLQAFVEELGSLEKVAASLGERYGEREIPAVLFEGGQKAEILALQAANDGGERPDMLGVAHSFRQAVEAGATVEEIAGNSGRHKNYVTNHLALTRIPAELAQRIAAGDLPMSVATAVADLPEPKRTGLAIFLLANGDERPAGAATAKAIKACAATLHKWSGLQPPLMAKNQAQRNIARALARLWGQAVAAYPEDAYAAAAMLIYRGVHEAPWAAKEKLTLWFQALGGDTYFSDGEINWPAVVEHLISEVACQSCPIAQLPQERLRSDLSQGQGGPLGMPCRVGQEASRCIHGLGPDDPFDARVPWSWSELPGVVHEDGEYRAKSYEDLLAAWQAQQAAEEERGRQGEGERRRGGEEETGREGEGESLGDSPTPTNLGQAVKSSPIVRQRAQIAGFMREHERLAAGHPFATACANCRHRLEASPTKPALSEVEVDESVPHCAWAGRLRNVSFSLLASQEEKAPRLPVCGQFAPTQPWEEIIPAHPQPPEIERGWLKTQVLYLTEEAGRHGGRRNPFEFLTGRPFGANENYDDWFSQQLEEQIGRLSDGQLFTLFIWAHSEWRRAQRRPFLLPLNGAQFAVYQEKSWRPGE